MYRLGPGATYFSPQKHSLTWCIDGTIKVVKSPFYQLLGIHCFVKSAKHMKQLPGLFCIMAGKKKRDYKNVFQATKGLFITSPSAKEVVVDLKLAFGMLSKKSSTQTLEVAHSIGGRQYGAHNLGLQFIRRLLVLPFLPAEQIQSAFTKMKEAAFNGQLKELVEYVESTWMNSSVWPISSWSIFGRSIFTNNDVEGWHHHLNRRARKNGLPFYLFITLLFKEASVILAQMKMVSEGKLQRRQRKETKQTQGHVFVLWKDFEEKTISVGHLFRCVARIYSPVD